MYKDQDGKVLHAYFNVRKNTKHNSHLEDTVLRYENCQIDNRHVARILYIFSLMVAIEEINTFPTKSIVFA